MSNSTIPLISETLVSYVAEALSPKPIKPTDTLAEIQYAAGQQQVIAFLRQMYDQQEQR